MDRNSQLSNFKLAEQDLREGSWIKFLMLKVITMVSIVKMHYPQQQATLLGSAKLNDDLLFFAVSKFEKFL
ncbi:hypothetical protein K1L80_000738 [Vibrio fluvialis]|nr:hypothetical protein [Vibrio fluvialis]